MIRSSVLKKYALFYVGVALMACVVVGSLLLWLSSRELNRSAEEDIRQRVLLAGEDFAAQEERLSRTAYAVKASAYCQPQYVRGGYLRERETISTVSRLQGRSAWEDSLFVWYLSQDAVYSGGAKYESYYFFHYRLSLQDPERMRDEISGTRETRWYEADANTLIRVQPISFVSVGGREERAVILSLIEKNAIARQVSFLTDMACLVEQGGEAGENWLPVRETEAFRVLVRRPAVWLDRVQSLTRLSILLTVCAGVFFVAFALTLAYLSWRPIRNLTARFSSGGSVTDEFRALDELIRNALEEKENSQKELLKQVRSMGEKRQLLRRMMLRLLLEGKQQPESGLLMEELGLRFPGPYYALLTLSPLQEGAFPAVEDIARELSGDGVQLYPLEGDQTAVLLVSLADQAMLPDLIEMVHASLEASGLPMRVYSGGVCDSPEAIPKLYAGARPEGETWSAPWYDDGSVDALLRALKAGRAEEAREQIRAVADSVLSRCAGEGLRRCAFVDVFTRLIQFSLDEHLPFPGELSARAAQISERNEFVDAMERAAETVLSRRYATSDREKLARRIAEYVDAHACELTFSLAELSEKFGLSERHAAGLLREYAGVSYKDYVTRLRIRRACGLLRESDIPIAEIHSETGYSSASHFVKVFRQATGMTPSAYRAIGGGDLPPAAVKDEDGEDEPNDVGGDGSV